MVDAAVDGRRSRGAYSKVQTCSVSDLLGSHATCIKCTEKTRLRPGDMHGKCARKYKLEGEETYGKDIWRAELSKHSDLEQVIMKKGHRASDRKRKLDAAWDLLKSTLASGEF